MKIEKILDVHAKKNSIGTVCRVKFLSTEATLTNVIFLLV
jgi:hypothetical protein